MATEKSKQVNKQESAKIENLAEEILRLQLMFWKMRHINRIDDPYDLNEAEYAALDALSENKEITVGQLQRILDVRSAQMSRIIRSLENKSGAKLVECSLNPNDKRKINVKMTETGKKAYNEYRNRRISANFELIMDLDPQERENLGKLLESYRKAIAKRLETHI